jgi:hypothetical protein
MTESDVKVVERKFERIKMNKENSVLRTVYIKKNKKGRSVIDPILTRVPDFNKFPNTDIKTPFKLQKAYNLPTVIPKDPSKRVKVGVLEPFYSDRCQQELDVYAQVHGLPPNKLILHFWNEDAKYGHLDFVPRATKTTHISMCIQAIYSTNPYAEIHVFNVPDLRKIWTRRALEKAGELGVHMVTQSYGAWHNVKDKNPHHLEEILEKYPNMLNFAAVGNGGKIKDAIANPSATRHYLSIGCSHLYFDPNDTNYRRLHEGASPGSSHGPCGPITPKPEWQKKISVLDKYPNKHCPDFVAFGNGVSVFSIVPIWVPDPKFPEDEKKRIWIRDTYVWGRGGATSQSSPIACGMLSLVNQALLNADKPTLTLEDLNKLFSDKEQASQCFYDITEIGQQPGWTRSIFRNLPHQGFDLVTGWGVPKIDQMISYFLNNK